MYTKLYADNGYWTAGEWAAFGIEAKAAKLATMDARGVWGQASVIAAAGRQPLEAVLRAWVQLGLVTGETVETVLDLAGQIRERAA